MSLYKVLWISLNMKFLIKYVWLLLCDSYIKVLWCVTKIVNFLCIYKSGKANIENSTEKKQYFQKYKGRNYSF